MGHAMSFERGPCKRCGRTPNLQLWRLYGWSDLGQAFCEACMTEWIDTMQSHPTYRRITRSMQDLSAKARLESEKIWQETRREDLAADARWQILSGLPHERLEIEREWRPEIKGWLDEVKA